MFCEKCGTQLPEDAKFCSNCGNNIKDEINSNKKISDTEIQFTIKPTFKSSYIIVSSIIIFVPFIFFLASAFMQSDKDLGIGVARVLGFIYVVCLVLKIIVNKKQYKKSTYYFYKTRVIYKDSFINISEKEVRYKYIREVTMRQNFIERLFNIGNIILHTNAESGYENGIEIYSIENVQKQYQIIKQIINKETLKD